MPACANAADGRARRAAERRRGPPLPTSPGAHGVSEPTDTDHLHRRTPRQSVAIRSLYSCPGRCVGRFSDVADKESEVAKPTTPTIREAANKLSTPSRVMAYVLGSAGLGAGGVAVFITHVEAGPVALLAVGLIFMIVALSGRLPTRLRVGDNEAEWQEVASNVIETAVDAAPPSVKAELAPQLSELAEVAPRAAVPTLSGLAYESYIEAAITATLALIPDVIRVDKWMRARGDALEYEFDFAVEASGNRIILIDVRGMTQLSIAQAAAILDYAQLYRDANPDSKVGLLLVSRNTPSPAIRALFTRAPNADYTVFSGSEGGSAFVVAISGLLSGLGS